MIRVTMPLINQTLTHNLTSLAEMCAQSGATASTVIYSSEQVVIFYKDPQTIEFREKDTFDELHIGLQQNACILIAVFPENT
jgi:hypothetical protein